MSASIRGHQGQFRAFENGALKNIFDITKVDVNQDSTFQRTFYVGRPVPEGDQVMEGFSGSIDLEVKDAEVETFIDALITNNLNGIGVSDYTFIVTENYPNGQTRSYVYFDVQWRYSRSQGGSNEKITKKLDWQAAGRALL